MGSVQYDPANPAHVVRIHSGLGNQLFQYAFGRGLEHKTGIPVLFETSSVGINKYRDYGLGIFRKAKIAIVDKCPEMRSLPRKSDYRGKFCVYDPSMFSDTPTYYNGCWQNEKYFKPIEQDIRTELTLPDLPRIGSVSRKADKISSCRTPVMVHVRRGDYCRLGWDLDIKYYRDAMRYMRKKLSNPRFFVFGEDERYIRGNFDDEDVEYGDVVPMGACDTPWYDIALMGMCKHAIIPNSTFAWWGAWLGKCNSGIVVAPEPWVHNVCGAVCDHWIKYRYKDKKYIGG